mgnify:FL=1
MAAAGVEAITARPMTPPSRLTNQKPAQQLFSCNRWLSEGPQEALSIYTQCVQTQAKPAITHSNQSNTGVPSAGTLRPITCWHMRCSGRSCSVGLSADAFRHVRLHRRCIRLPASNAPVLMSWEPTCRVHLYCGGCARFMGIKQVSLLR